MTIYDDASQIQGDGGHWAQNLAWRKVILLRHNLHENTEFIRQEYLKEQLARLG